MKCSVKIGFSKNWWIERKIATGQSPQLMFTPRYNRIPRKTKSKRMARGELDARSLYHLACDRVEWTSQLRRCITGTFSLTSCPKRQSRQRKALVRSSHLIDFVSLKPFLNNLFDDREQNHFGRDRFERPESDSWDRRMQWTRAQVIVLAKGN